MSFRVLFLRMVWVVAAALALSGCDKEDKKEDEKKTDKKDGLAVTFDPAKPEPGKKAKVVVTVTGEADGKINIGVMCGKAETLKAADVDVKSGKATSGDFDVPAKEAAKVTCKATAKGKIGGEDYTETASFEIGEVASALNAYSLTVGSITAGIGGSAHTVTVTLGKGDNTAIADGVTADVTLHAHCAGTAPSAGTDGKYASVTSWNEAMKTVSDSSNGTLSGSPPSLSTAVILGSTGGDDNHCVVRACAKVGSGSKEDSRENVCAYGEVTTTS